MNGLIRALCLVLFMFTAPWALSQQRLVLTTTLGLEYFNTIGELVLIEAYEKIGVKVEVLRVPSKRSLTMSNSGQSDGEVHRIKSITQKFTNLVQSPVSINHVEIVAFSKYPGTIINNEEELASYSIVYHKGAVVFEKLTAGFPHVKTVSISKQGLMMLANDRAEIFLGDSLSGPATVRENNIQGVYMLSPPVKTIHMYHCLNTNKSYLIPQITQVLKAMEASGRIKEIRDQYMIEYFKKFD
ncbi:hypothetical protein A9R01_00260 ['Osedax' symbiont bacterium Rs2_46_30_T18]|nr:hypothetical protein A9R01_00260 ['Osedax' symbiont bacterium Rs2_46_30_T18]